LLAAQVLADGDVLHLRGDDPLTGVFQLGDRRARLGAVNAARGGELRREVLALGEAVVLRLHLPRVLDDLDVAAGDDPRLAGARQALFDIDGDARVGIGPRTVVERQRRLAGALVHGDLAERHADVGPDHPGLVDLARPRALARGNGLGDGRFDVHRRGSCKGNPGLPAPVEKRTRALDTPHVRFPSLRRHDPDQVRRVAGSPASQPLERGPPENGRKTSREPRRAPELVAPRYADGYARSVARSRMGRIGETI